MSKSEYSDDVQWSCVCDNDYGAEYNDMHDASEESCSRCEQKRPKSLDDNPVLAYPMGPGWYWYQHPDTCEDNDSGPKKVDPTCMEIVLKGTEFFGLWQGSLVPLTNMPGKWQRVRLGAFHGA